MIDAKYISDALGGKKSGSGYIARCVSHEDENPSLSIDDGDKGVLVCCRAGCSQDAVIAALKARGLWTEKKVNGKEIISTYDYINLDGELVYQVVRYAPKDFRQRRPDGNGGWIWSLKDIERIPYWLADIKPAIDANEMIFVCEGEKDCDALQALGLTATTNAGGAGKWPASFAKWFVGARVMIIPDNDAPGRSHARQVSSLLGKSAKEIKVLELPGLPEKGDVSDWISAGGTREQLLRLASSAPTAANVQDAVAPEGHQAGDVIVQRLADIEAKPINWLWPGRIARGKPTLIAGHPGLGKSQITASMAAIATTGGLWPVDRSRAPTGSVVFLSAEDDAADTIRPRLEAAGADVTKIHIVQAVVDVTQNGEEVHRAFNLKADIRRLERAIAEIGDVVLVVIDPVSAYLGSGDSHNNAEMRGLLAPLSDMAARLNVAVVLISHLNKGGLGGDALMRVTGSLAFVAAARAAFIVAKDPEDEVRRLFIPAKNNLAKDVGGLAFKIESAVTNGIETSLVMWEATPVNDITADEILRQPADPEEKGARDEAKAFLVDLLARGAVGAKEVFANARDAGVSEKTLRRAAQDIGVEKSKAGMDGGWIWKLPSKMANHAEDALPKTEGTFGGSGHLQASRCPRCAGQGCRWCQPEVIVQ